MTDFNRRALLKGALAGAAVAAVGASILPSAIEAAPLAGGKTLPADATDEFAQQAWHRYWHRPRRRRRRRVCWWHRGHRHCAWRWY